MHSRYSSCERGSGSFSVATEPRENAIDLDNRVAAEPHLSGMTAPLISPKFGLASHVATREGVDVNVGNRREEVLRTDDQHRLEASLEHMSNATVPTIVMHRVAKIDAVHDVGDRTVDRLDDQVIVVDHQREREAARAHVAEDLGDDQEEGSAVTVVAKEGLSIQAPCVDVVAAAERSEAKTM